MNDEKMSLLFNAKLRSFEKINNNFLKAKAYVMALGKNANKSHFSKENVDKAYPTLAYAPVIGHLMSDENGNHYLGGHDVSLDLSTLTLKSLCVPFGVVMPSETPVYEDVVEANGNIATYLVSDVVLWTGRYPELVDAIYSDDFYFSQSMEILFSNAQPLKEDSTYTDVIDFSFDALCLLNRSDDPKFNVQPCFPSASIRPTTYSINQSEFTALVKEMKEQLSFCLNNTNINEGGSILNEKDVILQKYGKTIEDLDFSVDALTTEEFEAKMDELFGEKTTEPVAFSATYKQKREALSNALDPIIVKDSNGSYVEETYFYMEDFSDEYVFVERDHWTQSGYDCKYGRYGYTYDDSTMIATLTSDFEEMVKVWLTLDEKNKLDQDRSNFENISNDFSEYQKSHSYSNSEYDSIKTIADNLTKEKFEADVLAVLEEYENEIGETPEFTELKSKASEFSLESLEKECIYIVGRYARANKNNTPQTTEPSKGIKFSIENNAEETKPYGGLMEKYLKK